LSSRSPAISSLRPRRTFRAARNQPRRDTRIRRDTASHPPSGRGPRRELVYIGDRSTPNAPSKLPRRSRRAAGPVYRKNPLRLPGRSQQRHRLPLSLAKRAINQRTGHGSGQRVSVGGRGVATTFATEDKAEACGLPREAASCLAWQIGRQELFVAGSEGQARSMGAPTSRARHSPRAPRRPVGRGLGRRLPLSRGPGTSR